MDIIKVSEQMKEYAINIRRKLHRCPEIGMNEFQTKKIILEELSRNNIIYEEIGPTGVVGFVGSGNKTIALRADMDAIAVAEKNDVDYKSENEGKMHACGHDGHMAALLAAASVLKQYENELSVRIKLIFQPSEENCLGAKMMIDAGVLEDVSEIYGLHLFSFIPYGRVCIDAGDRMAITNNFKITINGKSGHAANPHMCVDATLAASSIVLNLQSVVRTVINPIHNAVLTIGKFSSGTAHNVISGKAVLEGTVRCFSDEDSNLIKQAMERIIVNTCDAYAASGELDFKKALHPQVNNDNRLVERFTPLFKGLFGDKLVHEDKLLLGEDFSSYQKLVPGVFAFVGAGDENGEYRPNHNERFNIDERSLELATAIYLLFALGNDEESVK